MEKLAENVRIAVANQSMGSGNLQNILQMADAVYRASSQTATVAAKAVKSAETTKTGTLQVEAFQRGRGRGGDRFGRGAG